MKWLAARHVTEFEVGPLTLRHVDGDAAVSVHVGPHELVTLDATELRDLASALYDQANVIDPPADELDPPCGGVVSDPESATSRPVEGPGPCKICLETLEHSKACGAVPFEAAVEKAPLPKCPKPQEDSPFGCTLAEGHAGKCDPDIPF